MKDFEPNIIVITEAEAKRLFARSEGMARADRRKAKEGQPEHIPTPPNDASKRLKIMESKQ